MIDHKKKKSFDLGIDIYKQPITCAVFALSLKEKPVYLQEDRNFEDI